MSDPTETHSDHFIPFSRAQIVRLLEADGGIPADDRERFGTFIQLLSSLYHFEFHAVQESFKRVYKPFNPDSDEQPDDGLTPAEAEAALWEQCERILTDGNFVHLSPERLEEVMAGEGLFPISLDVGFDDFEQYRVYYQGIAPGEAVVKDQLLPFIKRHVSFDVFERLVVLFKFKEESYFRETGKKIQGRPGKIYVKLLKNVPKQDIEMVFPNTRPQMKWIHKLKIGVPMLTGVALTLHKLAITPFLLGGKNPWSEGLSIGLVAILGGLIGYMFKSYSGYKTTVQTFQNEITSSLYFKNIVNNQAVFTTLVDTAEEEETKEALLAYYFLVTRAEPLTEPALDAHIEAWFADRHGTTLDFEVDDALAKLERFGLLTRADSGVLSVLPLDAALDRLDTIWDGLFSYSGTTAGS